MSDAFEFAPTASLDTLRHRAALLSFTRRFFDQHGYLEVETPLLSPDVVVDAHLEPFSTRFLPDPTSQSGPELFLQTSPEFSLKRLLACGSGPVFEVFRAFRNGERGRLHNPEFTLIEWYRPGDSYLEQMNFTEEYVRDFFNEAAALRCGETRIIAKPFERLSYDDAFQLYAGQRVLRSTVEELAKLARDRDVPIPPYLLVAESSRDAWLNLLLAEVVEPHLGVERPTFLYDYPASQAALARVRGDDPPVAERFELYIDGIELCNGYHELLDAKELRRRNCEQNRKRAELGLRTLPEDSRLLAAMEHGLPACSGVALGFDRLVMIALGKDTIGGVRAFLTEERATR
ncbi:MAG: EF-P lysine aminoacylase EpmA [Planctomycetota bacterium]|nr:EF-P lysine aminoacylase GenX [Planctomycetaceae bacterium]MDQ3329369.1 EF-P lysine aminoacylase EpmA [Planctomycetota bacterium]